MTSAVGSIVITTPAPCTTSLGVWARLATTGLKLAKVLRVAVPCDDGDVLIEQPMGHRGTHQAEAQQSNANLRRWRVRAHCAFPSISAMSWSVGSRFAAAKPVFKRGLIQRDSVLFAPDEIVDRCPLIKGGRIVGRALVCKRSHLAQQPSRLLVIGCGPEGSDSILPVVRHAEMMP